MPGGSTAGAPAGRAPARKRAAPVPYPERPGPILLSAIAAEPQSTWDDDATRKTEPLPAWVAVVVLLPDGTVVEVEGKGPEGGPLAWTRRTHADVATIVRQHRTTCDRIVDPNDSCGDGHSHLAIDWTRYKRELVAAHPDLFPTNQDVHALFADGDDPVDRRAAHLFVANGDRWDVLYRDGEQILDGHHVERRDLRDAIRETPGTRRPTVVEWGVTDRAHARSVYGGCYPRRLEDSPLLDFHAGEKRYLPGDMHNR
jgi:hypothetical protein